MSAKKHQQPRTKRQDKVWPAPVDHPHTPSEGPGNYTRILFSGSVQSQAARIERRPSAQQGAMVTEIGRVQGNRHVQRVVAALRLSPTGPTVPSSPTNTPLRTTIEPLPGTAHGSSPAIETEFVIQRAVPDAVIKAVTKRALKWLSKRSKVISSHVARHTRAIARAGIHSIFKKGGSVKKLVKSTISSPDRVAITLGMVKGHLGKKLIYLKDFGRVVGRNGETIIKVVVSKKTGEIITAYPVRAMAAALAAGGVYGSIDEAAAASRTDLDKVNKEAERRLEAAEPSFWSELFSDIITFGLYGGELNSGEDVALYVQREVKKIIKKAYEDVIRKTEEKEKRSLSKKEREEILNLVKAAVTMADVLEAAEPP